MGLAITRRVALVWRAVRTGTAFAMFGVACLFVTYVGLPLAVRFGANEPDDLRSQRILSRWCAWFEGVMTVLGLIEVELIGTERLRGQGPLLIVANHPTLIDVLLLIAHLPQADCIVSSRHADRPILRPLVAMADYLLNDRGPQVVADGARRLSEGRTLLMFPEGSRSPAEGLGSFYRGAAYIALAGGWDPVPVTITCEPRTLMRGKKWYDVPASKARYVIRVDDPISVKPYLEIDRRSIAARELNARLREHYEARLHCERR